MSDSPAVVADLSDPKNASKLPNIEMQQIGQDSEFFLWDTKKQEVVPSYKYYPTAQEAKPFKLPLLGGGDFDLAAEKGKVIVLDFWATWCAPCRMIAPIVEQLAADYAGKVKVAKLDVDNNQRTAAKFNVRSIPTILFFKDGKLVDQVVGAVPRPALEAKFKEHA